jgi:5-methylcytosine-specific restriction endonuclease McrA
MFSYRDLIGYKNMKFELEPYHRNVSEEELIADLKRVASELKTNVLSGIDYKRKGKYSQTTFANKFGSWEAALEKANLKRSGNFNLTDEELIKDLIQVATSLKKDSLTQAEYDQDGKFNSGTIKNRFNSWNKALKQAGLKIKKLIGITEDQGFENLEEVWVKLGRQPHRSDMQKPLSKYSGAYYERKFGTWRKALERFIEYINKEETSQVEQEHIVEDKVITTEKEPDIKHKTKRDISERLKVRVLMRDGNKCRLCGITVTGENIHFDHIKAWSKGGETVLENLQVLCARHNLAKGNL